MYVCVCVFSVLEIFHGLEQIFTGVLVPEKGESHFSKVLRFSLSLIFWLCNRFCFVLFFSHYFHLNSLTLLICCLCCWKAHYPVLDYSARLSKWFVLLHILGILHGLNKGMVFIKIFYAYAIWSNKHLSLYKWKRVKRWHRKMICICGH